MAEELTRDGVAHGDAETLDAMISVTAAFHALRDRIRAPIQERMTEALGADWVSTCHDRLRLRESYDVSDLYFTLKVAQRWWYTLVPGADDRHARPDFEMLIAARNRWAHWAVSSDDADQVNASCESMALALGCDWPEEPLLKPMASIGAETQMASLIESMPADTQEEGTIFQKANEEAVARILANRDPELLHRSVKEALDYHTSPVVGVQESLSWISQPDRRQFERNGLEGWFVQHDGGVRWDPRRMLATLTAVALTQPGSRTPLQHARLRVAFALTMCSGSESASVALNTLQVWALNSIGFLHKAGFGSVGWLAHLCHVGGQSAGRTFAPWLVPSGREHRQDFEFLSMSGMPPNPERADAAIAISQWLLASAGDRPAGFGEAMFWWTCKVGRELCRISVDDVVRGKSADASAARALMGATARTAKLMERFVHPDSLTRPFPLSLEIPPSSFEGIRSIVD